MGAIRCHVRRALTVPAAAIAVACGGSVAGPVAVGPAVDAGTFAADTGSPPTGPKCSAIPTQLVAVNDVGPLDPVEVDLCSRSPANCPPVPWVPGDLAVNATDLYYIAFRTGPGEKVMRVPIRGGGKPVLVAAPILSGANSLLLTSDSVLFSQGYSGTSTGEIVRAPLLGGATTVLATTNGPSTSALATAGQNVYFADNDGAKSIRLADGTVKILTTRRGDTALVGSNLILATGSDISSIPIAGGPLTVLATNQAYARFPLRCGSDICWLIPAPRLMPVPPAFSAPGALMKLASNAAPVVLSQALNLYDVQNLVFDGDNFFATEFDRGGELLMRIPAAGGPPIDMGNATGVAVDDTCLYTASMFAGIYTVSKSFTGTLPP
jgi:hypothetical protein